eukprot:gb/GEZN01004022.1/.p1 GENE.gb/GEZN01004022.1/~~gb/GEZN01004022.1/.p1  ORF type:complete len:494 (-),score=99.38 gb/GEZN01004022.1/:511-1992(-)
MSAEASFGNFAAVTPNDPPTRPAGPTTETATPTAIPSVHSVYVDRIPSEWAEEELCQLFSACGTITRAKVMLDQATGRSLGFGFVHYDSEEESQKAIKLMDQKEVEGKVLVVRHAKKRQDNVRQQAQAMNLYVSGMANRITEDEVKSMFGPFGVVTSVTLLKPKPSETDSGQSSHRGVGFVHFSNSEEGQAAINALHGTQALGSPGITLTVKVARPKAMAATPKMNKLPYQNNAPHNAPHNGFLYNRVGVSGNFVASGGVRPGAGPAGPVRQPDWAQAPPPHQQGRQPDWAAQPYAASPYPGAAASPYPVAGPTSPYAQPAQQMQHVQQPSASVPPPEQFNNAGGGPPRPAGYYPPHVPATELPFASSTGMRPQMPPQQRGSFPPPDQLAPMSAGGSNGWGRPPPTQGEGGGGQTLFVYHVPSELTEGALAALFSPYGTITRTNIIKDKQTNQPKGYAFVSFTHSDDAAQAIQGLNGFRVGSKYLSVSVHKPK